VYVYAECGTIASGYKNPDGDGRGYVERRGRVINVERPGNFDVVIVDSAVESEGEWDLPGMMP
jgi:hypothetical protein